MESFINAWALVYSAILSLILGMIWYGPLFGKMWMKMAGIQMPDKKPCLTDMLKPIALSMLGAVALGFALSSLIAFHDAFYGTSGFVSALSLAAFIWVGFIIPIFLNFIGWEGKPWKYLFLHAGYWLVFLLLAATGIVLLG